LTLWVRPDNRAARRLFEASGFRPTGRSDADDAGDTVMHMQLALAQEEATAS
jgi:RimJ/RimL family protein N-acetyltransferase